MICNEQMDLQTTEWVACWYCYLLRPFVCDIVKEVKKHMVSCDSIVVAWYARIIDVW